MVDGRNISRSLGLGLAAVVTMLSGLFPAHASATTYYDIGFGGTAAGANPSLAAVGLPVAAFYLRNSTNGLGSVLETYPGAPGGSFDATFRYVVGDDGSLSLSSIDASIRATGLDYGLYPGVFTPNPAPQDIWQVQMETSGAVIDLGSAQAGLATGVATTAGERLGEINSLNTRYQGIPRPTDGAHVFLEATDDIAMTIRWLGGNDALIFPDLDTALASLSTISLGFVWDGVYRNPASCATCGQGSFVTWVNGTSSGVRSVSSDSTSVPEPASVALTGIALLAALRRRTRRDTSACHGA